LSEPASVWHTATWPRRIAPLLTLVILATTGEASPRAAAQPAGDCALAPWRERIDAAVASITVEHEDRVGRAANLQGQPYKIVDVGLSGTVDGCVVKSGPIPALAPDGYSWLYDAPDISLPEEHVTAAPSDVHPLPYTATSGNTSQRYYARGTFRAADGAGITFFLPAAGTLWNGKLYVVERGSGIAVRQHPPTTWTWARSWPR